MQLPTCLFAPAFLVFYTAIFKSLTEMISVRFAACTYAGDIDSVQVTFHNVPAHMHNVHISPSCKLDTWDHKHTPKSK